MKKLWHPSTGLIIVVAASYGISDYRFAAIQLSQTTLRSEVGKIFVASSTKTGTGDQAKA